MTWSAIDPAAECTLATLSKASAEGPSKPEMDPGWSLPGRFRLLACFGPSRGLCHHGRDQFDSPHRPGNRRAGEPRENDLGRVACQGLHGHRGARTRPLRNKDQLVEDPVAKIRFPKYLAASALERDGRTYYFVDEDTRRELEQATK